MKVAKEGIPFIALFAGATAALTAVGLWLLGPWGWVLCGVGAVLTGWCFWFFRDPERVTPQEPRAIISPADGVVCLVGRAEAPPELGLTGSGPFQRVCVFMNVFNVHVNRVPCDGLIEKAAYTPGKFFNASLDKASVHNERMAVAMRTTGGERVLFVQIAGLVARRIVCYLTGGESVRAGERFGLIRFGSRVDVYLPVDSEVNVTVGQKTVAGETVLARLPVPRTGEAAASGVARTAQEVPVGR